MPEPRQHLTAPREPVVRAPGSTHAKPCYCSACGVKDGPKPLHTRVWTCGARGTVLDRDVNAAVNIGRQRRRRAAPDPGPPDWR